MRKKEAKKNLSIENKLSTHKYYSSAACSLYGVLKYLNYRISLRPRPTRKSNIIKFSNDDGHIISSFSLVFKYTCTHQMNRKWNDVYFCLDFNLRCHFYFEQKKKENIWHNIICFVLCKLCKRYSYLIGLCWRSKKKIHHKRYKFRFILRNLHS